MKNKLLSICLLVGLHGTATAQEEVTLTTQILTKTTTSWDGSTLPAYPQGQPEITVSRITLPAGIELSVHKHPVPLSAYVVSGTLTVIKNDEEQAVFTAGEVIVETVDIWHYGENAGTDDVVLIAFYAGIEGALLSILEE